MRYEVSSSFYSPKKKITKLDCIRTFDKVGGNYTKARLNFISYVSLNKKVSTFLKCFGFKH